MSYVVTRSSGRAGTLKGCDRTRSGIAGSRNTQRYPATASAESDPSMPANNAQSAMDPGAIIVSSFSSFLTNSDVPTVGSGP